MIRRLCQISFADYIFKRNIIYSYGSKFFFSQHTKNRTKGLITANSVYPEIVIFVTAVLYFSILHFIAEQCIAMHDILMSC